MLAGRTQFKNTDLPSDSLSRERNYVLNYVFMTDTDGNKEPTDFSVTLENGFKNFTDLQLKVFFRSSIIIFLTPSFFAFLITFFLFNSCPMFAV